MLNIFEFNEGKIGLSIDVLSHPVLKKIYDRDNNTHKGEALLEYTYLNYYCSPRKTNPFFGYTDLTERHEKIIKSIYKGYEEDDLKERIEYYKVDSLIQICISIIDEIYEDNIPTLRLYKDCVQAAKNVGTFIKHIDLEATTNSGAAKYKPADVTNAIASAEEVAIKLNNLKNAVEAEIVEATKTVKNRSINYFEQVENADE